jgi:hypothetical protein
MTDDRTPNQLDMEALARSMTIPVTLYDLGEAASWLLCAAGGGGVDRCLSAELLELMARVKALAEEAQRVEGDQAPWGLVGVIGTIAANVLTFEERG